MSTKPDLNTAVDYLGSLISKTEGFVRHLDIQTNILIVLSSTVFLFSSSRIDSNEGSLFIFILFVFSGISALVALFAIHPPRYMRKRGQEESLMYTKKIYGFPSHKEYFEETKRVLDDSDQMIHQYTTEVYNLSKFYYKPKRTLFRLSRNLFLSGIIFSFLSFLF